MDIIQHYEFNILYFFICIIEIFVHNTDYKTYINYYIQFYMSKYIELILQNIYSVIAEYRYY